MGGAAKGIPLNAETLGSAAGSPLTVQFSVSAILIISIISENELLQIYYHIYLEFSRKNVRYA